MTCPGIEIEPGIYSGCGGGWDCPVCGGGAPEDVQLVLNEADRTGDYNPALQALVDAAKKRDALRAEVEKQRKVIDWLEEVASKFLRSVPAKWWGEDGSALAHYFSERRDRQTDAAEVKP